MFGPEVKLSDDGNIFTFFYVDEDYYLDDEWYSSWGEFVERVYMFSRSITPNLVMRVIRSPWDCDRSEEWMKKVNVIKDFCSGT